MRYVGMTAVVMVGGWLLTGCAQNQESRQAQAPEQSQVTPTQTRQYEKTAGPLIQIAASNVPNPTTRPAEATQGAVTRSVFPEISSGVGAVKSDAGYVVVQNITINIGNQEPTATGTTTGTANATQTPSVTHTSTPTQTVTPEFTSAVPINVGMPGSAVSGTATAAGQGGQTGQVTASPTQTPTYTAMTATAAGDKLAAIIAAMQSWLQALQVPTDGTPVPQSQPVK